MSMRRQEYALDVLNKILHRTDAVSTHPPSGNGWIFDCVDRRLALHSIRQSSRRSIRSKASGRELGSDV